VSFLIGALWNCEQHLAGSAFTMAESNEMARLGFFETEIRIFLRRTGKYGAPASGARPTRRDPK
jgi:hypothetical protein